MGSIFASSRPGGLGSTIVGCALLAGVAHGCGRADDGQHEVLAPGDVPWLGACAEDADCAEGQCVCGLCSTPCVEGACDGEGPPNAQCLQPEHWLSAALCAGRGDAPMCLTGCDASSPCEAAFDCLDGFCVPSPAATVAREQELIPIGPLCERDRVVWRSLLLERPEQVEALRGCERIEGNLRVDADAISELSALGSLRSVSGSLDVLAQSPAAAADAVPFDLSGLERLERVGRLRLASVAVSTLAPLSSLRTIEGPSDSGLYLAEVSELTSLDGLRSLERVKRIELSDVPGLRSLRGLQSLREVEALDVRGVPLEEIAAPGQLALTGSLNLEWTSLVSLRGLAESSRPSSVRLANNRLLVSLDGLRVAEALEELSLEGNTALEDIRALGGVREVNGPLVLSGSPLRSLEGLDALERVAGLTLSGTAVTDLRGLGRLESAEGIEIRENPALVTLAGLAPAVTILWLSVVGNPSLTQLSLGNANIDALLVFECPIPDLSGLEAVTLNRQLTLDGVPNLTSLSGFSPGPVGLAELTLGRCPRLTDLGALAGLSALDWLAIRECGMPSLDALGSLRRLGALDLGANPNLTSVQALASLEQLGSISVWQNPALAELPSFAALLDASEPASCGGECGFVLSLDNNAALRQGPGFPALAHAAQIQIDGNPNLASMGSFAALRSVFRLQVEGNLALGVLGLTNVETASSIIVRGNAALPESEIEALRAADANERRIASNGSGPERLDPCPWSLDGACDEVFEVCAAGTDAVDCVGYEPLAWGSAGSLAP